MIARTTATTTTTTIVCLPQPSCIIYALHHPAVTARCVEISTNESIVVYRAPAHASLEDAKADASLPGIERKVITGPLLYTPSEKEFMHYFSWHGYEHGDVRG